MIDHRSGVGIWVLLLGCLWLGSGCAHGWQVTGVGDEAAPTPVVVEQQTVSITGTGAGLDPRGADKARFVFTAAADEDFEIVARLASLDGPETASAGLMARAAGGETAPMVALVYTADKPALGWRLRLPEDAEGLKPRARSHGITLAQRTPLWLKLVRVGDNFGVYKSRDGRLWSMLSNVSGAPAILRGELRLGAFVASGSDTAPATAVLDHLHVGKPRLRYRTSWVGNTFGSRGTEGHVSNSLSAMWVAPDGTCYTSSYWDEGGRPVAAYRDGRPLRSLLGTPQSHEGGITGDDRYIYAAYRDRIMQIARDRDDVAPQPIVLSVSLHNDARNQSVVSGLASNGKELFVADSRDDLVRVVLLQPVPTFHTALAANDRIVLAPGPVEVPNEPRFAPPLVYRTQRAGELNQYRLPGLDADATYTVRLHLAEYEKRKVPPDHRDRLLSVDGDQRLNIGDLAGGVLKAVVHDLPNLKPDKNGELVISFGSYGQGVCGLEVLDAQGKQVLAINCGGPAVDGFSSESQELVDRAFPFERPGPMILDSRGYLWIIQRGRDFPIGSVPVAEHPAAIRCYRPDGSFTGHQIADVINPRGLGYDSGRDRLLVAENGPDLNVRIYRDLASGPTIAGTFGVPGGIYAGQHPGQVVDPQAGGYARFPGLAGVGMDADGNLYVGGGIQGTDLRMFRPDGSLGWMLNSQIFCNTYDVDPDSDGADIYSTYNHLKLDLAQSEPGGEQTYHAYNWDVRRFGAPERVGNSQSILRRLGPERDLFMFTTGQGVIGDIYIFRYEGELAIPCGGTRDRGKRLWTDANGNGQEDDGESSAIDGNLGWITGVAVDSRGDIWAAVASTGGSYVGHFRFLGLNEHGVPRYSGAKGPDFEVIPLPEEAGSTNAWSMVARIDYDAERDILVALFPAERRQRLEDGSLTDPKYLLARYDRWSEGNRTNTWKYPALDPNSHPGYFMYESNPGPYNLYDGFMGMQIAGDYVFMADLWGQVYAFSLATGELAEILSVGPEMGGQSAWEDAAMGLRAFRRKNGEYLIFTENSGWGGKNNFWRWKP